MRISLPERNTDPELVKHLGITVIPDTLLTIDTRGCVEVTPEFLDALRKHAITACDPYYAHLRFIVNEDSLVFNDIRQFVATRSSSTHSVDMSGKLFSNCYTTTHTINDHMHIKMFCTPKNSASSVSMPVVR